ncbi:MAG: heavy metal-responsive transcriptional regulator [Acidimicrobiia bacterium]|nr:heavy metal-responsive transcriptional regulator [Acidimicrobiia bacterium]
MKIGDVANSCGVPTQTIRFYEKRGLLPEPTRLPNGYRSYDHTTVERIAFIRRSHAAGLTLTEIGGVLDVRSAGHAPCSHVSDLLTTKLGEVNDRIDELTVLRAELTTLVGRSKQLDPADCTTGQICHILRAD